MEKHTVVSCMLGLLMFRYKKREMEVEELKQQLNSAKMCEENAQGGHHWFKEEERHLRDECEFLKQSLDMERRRSANFELQVCVFKSEKCKHPFITQMKKPSTCNINSSLFSDELLSEVHAKLSPCRPGEDCRPGATGMNDTLTLCVNRFRFGISSTLPWVNP